MAPGAVVDAEADAVAVVWLALQVFVAAVPGPENQVDAALQVAVVSDEDAATAHVLSAEPHCERGR